MFLNKYGLDKVSALPTFTDFTKIEETIDFYIELGLKSIFSKTCQLPGLCKKKISKFTKPSFRME